MPETLPSPLAAYLAAAKRDIDRLRDLAETLLPESSPVKTADNPAVVLPTVDEAAEAVVQSTRDEGWSYRTTAQAVLDLIAARVPVWVPIEWDAIRPGMLVRGTRPGYRIELTVGRIDGSTVRGVGGGTWMRTLDEETATWEVDPRTVPAEPEDPRVAVVVDYFGTSDENARELLARLDAARADQ